MRYVSQRLRDVSKVSLLWNEFVWPDYEPHHISGVCEIFKVHGKNMRRILFPGYLAPAKILEVVHCCTKVKHLSLLKNTQLSLNDLEKIVHTMPHLQQLDVFIITEKFIQRAPLHGPILVYAQRQSHATVEGLLKVAAASVRELTLRIKGYDVDDAVNAIRVWAEQGNPLPSIINILTENDAIMKSDVCLTWSMSYSNINLQLFEVGFYDIKRVPMNLYPPMPLKKFYFGPGETLPLIQLSNYGIQGLKHDIFHLNDYDDNGTVRHTVTHCSMRYQIERRHLNKISHLHSVSYINFCYAGVFPHDLEQLAIACPNLQRLNLMENINCLENFNGLQAIVRTCVNLQGLNLAGISVSSMKSPHLLLWELLSSLKKLTHLAINLCALNPSYPFDDYRKEFINKFKSCHSLQALEIHCCDRIYCCRQKNKDYLFSYFPSLTYCRMIDFPYYPGFVHAINNCHQLKCLYEESEIAFFILPGLSNNCHLQQLYIDLLISLPDELVNTLSAHGRLECVILLVWSITFSSIITLIKNSPNLTLLCISTREPLCNHNKNYGSYEDKVKKMFSYHKLFAVGNFKVESSNSAVRNFIVKSSKSPFTADLFNTDLNSSWWPPAPTKDDMFVTVI